jgi:methylated-DNA-[protein]-cysteine S-methyltransferase
MDECFAYFQSPVGTIHIRANHDFLLSVRFADSITDIGLPENTENTIIKATTIQLTEYFNKQRKTFDLPLSISSGTEFQQKVWTAVNDVEWGKTLSYIQLAQKLGSEKLVRAVGTANGRNPFLVIIPCHRIIGANGKLVGYAGELWRKQWLLEHEGSIQQILF